MAAIVKPDFYGYQGLSKVAHAIRRSTALTVAMNITPANSKIEEMLVVADRLALWLAGEEGRAEAERAQAESPPREDGTGVAGGKAWPPVD